MNALAFILKVLEALPGLIAAGQDAYQFVALANASVQQMAAENRGPSDAEWAALHDKIDALMSALES